MLSFKHQPGLFQKTTEKARVLSKEPNFKTERICSSLRMNIKGIQFTENECKASKPKKNSSFVVFVLISL